MDIGACRFVPPGLGEIDETLRDSFTEADAGIVVFLITTLQLPS
jgi:hypothetical protein